MPNTSVSTYALPSEIKVGNGGSVSDDSAKARRVQQQIQMRLAEKSTLPRQNGSTSHYAMSDYGGSSSVKYNTHNPSFSSKSSFMYSGSRTIGPQLSQRSGFSSRSAAPDMAGLQRMSMRSGGPGYAVGGGGGGFYQEEMRMGTMKRMDPEISTHSMQPMPMQMRGWGVDNSDAGSLVSERDATYGRSYAQSAVNGYTSQMMQGGGSSGFQSTMRRSLSGTLSRGGGVPAGGTEIVQQQSFKGPAHRTISRITNRNRMSVGSMSGTMQQTSGGSVYGGGGDTVDGGFMMSTMSGSQGNLRMQRQGTMSRAMSVKSMQSVGRGMDIYDGQMELGASMGNLSGLDMQTAVQYLTEEDPSLQALGAAYIQHQCYNDKDSKNLVRQLGGIGDLVQLFNSQDPEVRRYATGATRNIIYENQENKSALIDKDGIQELVKALEENDDELRKNITGIFWNLSSKENLKEKLAKATLHTLAQKILVPLSKNEMGRTAHTDSDTEIPPESPSETEIFCNATGCLRNLSSVNEKTRRSMRETTGIVESLVNYIKACLKTNRADEKGVENSVCILRNLSYQLYSELPSSVLARIEPNRDQDNGLGESIGCFTPQSRKTKTKKKQFQILSQVAKMPNGMDWLWHPDILKVYHELLKKCEINSNTREAAAGALQNITAGDKRWPAVLSDMALDKERMVPTIIDMVPRSAKDAELRSLTGFLRNLSRHTDDKDDMAKKTVNTLVDKLPMDGNQKFPSSESVVNICGVFNNLVTGSMSAARDIAQFDGLLKLISIHDTRTSSLEKNKASTAAATVLSNMYHYKKLHRQYQSKGFTKQYQSTLLI
ncbi:plakophilin-3a isoform X2 [Astatotilapia calliptera]|nr:plakophilin-3 isoform X2 [Astatotilapia calliptera]